jgi:hypothetical protein
LPDANGYELSLSRGYLSDCRNHVLAHDPDGPVQPISIRR